MSVYTNFITVVLFVPNHWPTATVALLNLWLATIVVYVAIAMPTYA